MLGTVLAGFGLVLVTCQTTMTLPLTVALRIGGLTALELAKQLVMLAAIALLVLVEAGLLPFFAVSIAVGLVALAVSPRLLGSELVWRPAFAAAEWRLLIRETLPLAAAVVIGVVYFRLLILLMSLLATAVETGLFATSFRVTELLYSVAALGVSVVLPVLSVAVEEPDRLRYMLQRMIEVAFILSTFLVLVVFILAEPVLELLGGPSYRDAAPVLRIQVFALIPVFLGQVLVMGLISVRRPSVQVVANGLAVPVLLVLGVVLIPREGATGAAVRQSSPRRCTPSRSSFSSSGPSARCGRASVSSGRSPSPRPSAPGQRSSRGCRQSPRRSWRRSRTASCSG